MLPTNSRLVSPVGRMFLSGLLVCLVGANFSLAAPPTLYWNGEHLAAIKSGTTSHTPEITHSLQALKVEADAALQRGPYSVMDKQLVPPSGDKHDYLSYSRYWWPNPETADGLPYIRRDGVVNRKLLAQGDRVRVGMLYDDVESLALAAYLIDDDRYASHAVDLVRTWFINPATRMNPHLSYGQGVPGRAVGRGVGIIDTRHFIRLLDGVALLVDLGAFSEADLAELKQWNNEYLDWLLTSKLGAKEQSAKNNHGTWFAAQASYLALFLGKKELAAQIAREVQTTRLAHSIGEDGSQPLELRRTRSLHYSLFNLVALSVVSRVGEQVGVDLWQGSAESPSAMKRALDYVTPYVVEPTKWEHPEFDDFALSQRQQQPFLLAAVRFQDPQYAAAAKSAPPRKLDRPFASLLFPSYQPPAGE